MLDLQQEGQRERRSLLARAGVVGAGTLVSRVLELGRDMVHAAVFYRVRVVSLIALAVASTLGVLFARQLTELFAGGYRDRPGELERTVTLTRWVFPYLLCIGTAALGMAALNAKRRFAVASFAPGLLNVGIIASALALPATLAASGHDVALALPIGALVGGVLQVMAQAPALRAIGFAAWPRFEVDDEVRKVFRRIAPLTLGIGIYSID